MTSTGRVDTRSDGTDALDVVDAIARDAFKAMMFGRPKAVRRIGRYRVTGVLGEGGMGVVYAGHDEELDRPVAIKLLRTSLPGDLPRERLLREAQGLARLSHPNVVQVHEIGEHEGSIFVTMELVQGKTLRAWIEHTRAERGGWKARLSMLIQAGRGLEAAHEAELIHRDFKPDNAIVGDDGRVRVLDFGLVRGLRDRLGASPVTTAVETEVTAPRSSDSTGPRALESTLTMVGTVMGTPAYMAPEQLEGESVEAAADQFAFCVSCFEALFGQRPFEGKTIHALRDSVLDGRIVERPKGSGVPRPVEAAILRGLSREPAARWPSMSALLAELESHLRPRRAMLWGTLGLGLLATGASVGATALSPEPPAPCQIDASALGATWDATRRDALRQSFVESALPFGPTAHAAVEARLEGWAESWVASLRSACEATRVAGIASDAQLDRRTRCLDRRRRDFDAMVGVLVEGRPEAIGGASLVLAAMPKLEACEDPEAANEPGAPEEPELASARDGLARAVALRLVGAHDEAGALADAALRVGAEHGDRPLQLEARALRARLRINVDDVDEGAQELLAILHEAQGAHLDELAAELWAVLAVGVAGSWSQPKLEAFVLDQAEAWSERLGLVDPASSRALARARVELELAAGHPDRALALMTDWPVDDDDSERAIDEQLEGRALVGLGRHPEARARFEAARERAAAVWGEGSWLVADLELSLGQLALERGEFERAAEALERAETHYRAILGPDAADVALARLLRAKLDLSTGEVEQAHAELESLVEVFERRFGASDARTSEAYNALGIVRFYVGDFTGSVVAYQRALEIARVARGELHADVGLLHANLGESLAAAGDHPAALAAYQHASEIFAVSLAPDDPLHAVVLKGRAESRLVRHQTAEAIADLERALALYGEGHSEPYERADIHRSLALALAEQGEDPTQARAHARRAAELFASLGMDAELDELRSLL